MSDKNPKHCKKTNTNINFTHSMADIKAQSVAEEFVTDRTFSADPLGSYTGTTKEKGEKPNQDADDL